MFFQTTKVLPLRPFPHGRSVEFWLNCKHFLPQNL